MAKPMLEINMIEANTMETFFLNILVLKPPHAVKHGEEFF